ncbi:MAG: heme-binding protein [Bacteroidetes bacterium]|nr:MAG: heme-binding protein [Bacteroidota bacterium]
MKWSIITLSVLALGLLVFQSFTAKYNRSIETYPYRVLKQYEGFEIREYLPRNFIYVTMPASTYSETSGKGFRYLAGYIFGSNDQQKKIAMTAPVAMNMEDSVTMMFMVPKEYDLKDLPVPNQSEIKFTREPSKVVAAIKFSGWANDEKIRKYASKLKSLLHQNKLNFASKYSYFGYNAPYEMINRRNEIVIELSPSSAQQFLRSNALN